jgi:hypothetical protein
MQMFQTTFNKGLEKVICSKLLVSSVHQDVRKRAVIKEYTENCIIFRDFKLSP